MRMILTGATGFLGSRLLKLLLKDSHRIAVLKRQRSDLFCLRDCQADIQLFDIEAGLDAAFAAGSVDVVIHLATCYGRGSESIGEVFAANTVFPFRLLEAAVSAHVPLFINTDTALDKFLNPYSLSKRHFAEWGKWMAERGKIHFLNVRLEHIYGPGDHPTKFTSRVIRSLCKNQAEIDLTAGEQLRDFVYIDDVLSAYRALLNRPMRNIESGFMEIGLGSGQSVRVRDFVELVHELTGSRTVLRFGAVPYRPGEAMLAQADISYLRQLGWRPLTALPEGIRKTIEIERIKRSPSRLIAAGD